MTYGPLSLSVTKLHFVYQPSFRFVACQEALLTFDYDGQYDLDDDFWNAVSKLADDAVIGVRIGIARLLGHLSGMLCCNFIFTIHTFVISR